MSAEFKPLWIETNNTEGHNKTPHFLRRSEIMYLGKGSSFQVALISPAGFVESGEMLHFGFASGNTSIRYLFPEFGSPGNTQLTLSIGQENFPKADKRVSGDLVATVLMFEREKSTRNFTILNLIVDNLSTKSDERYGLLKIPSDGYATECSREALIKEPQKYLDFCSFTRLLHPDPGSYGVNGNLAKIPQHALKLRNAVLGLFSNQLPFSEPDSEKFRGVYGFTLSRLRIDPVIGASGDCIAVRSIADVNINVNNRLKLVADNHRPAQAVAKALGKSTEEIYRAKLGTHIYDTTGFGFRENVGEFEIAAFDCTVGKGEVSNSICIESDGYELGKEIDDASRLNMYFYANS